MAAAAVRRLAVVVGFAVMGTVASGCGGDGDDPPSDGSTPPPAASPAGVDPVGVPTGSEFPESVQEYAETAVAAWAAPDLIRLAALTTTEVYEQIIELPGPPDQSWRFIQCQEDALATGGSADCAFHNADGDYLVLAVARRLLGEPQAVMEATFDTPTYPDQPEDYVEAFVEAWRAGNLARMELLAVADVAATFQQLAAAPEEVGYRRGDADDHAVTVLLTLTGTDDETGTDGETGADGETGTDGETEAEVRLSRSRLGDQKAITGAEMPEA